MTLPNYRVRRATLDDLSALKALWASMHFSGADLEKGLTEFQVVAGADGKLLGAIALQIADKSGRIHSEAFTDFGLAEELRSLLWERLQVIALNFGLLRLWTKESAPFWNRCGLLPADAKTLEKLPRAWAGDTANWLTVQLRDETAVASVDKEFALFMAAEKQRTARALGYAKTLKRIATAIAIILALFVLAFLARIFLKNPQLLNPQLPGR